MVPEPDRKPLVETTHILELDMKDMSALLIFDDVHKADPSVLSSSSLPDCFGRG